MPARPATRRAARRFAPALPALRVCGASLAGTPTAPSRGHRALPGLMVLAALAAPLAGPAAAQSWPAKPVTIVVPFPAGGPNDILARGLGEQIAMHARQPVIVENKSGATGNVGAIGVTRAAPDGYTLLLTLDTSLTANPELYGKRMGFDAERDLRPVTLVARFNQMLVVNPTRKITTFKQFVERARAGLNYASAGNASPGHLTMEALQSSLQSKLNHVPYRGNAPAVTDLLGGQVDAGFVATSSVAQYLPTGKLTPLAVSGTRRSPLAPNVPTVAELGVPEATTEFAYVLLAPAATPDPLLQAIHAETRTALAVPALRDRLKALDIEPLGSATPAQTASELAAGRARWTRIIRERGITPD